jgi:hypothetical protein
MSDMSTIESRLEAVEKEIAQLKRRLGGKAFSRPWYEPLFGSMKDFPEFDEVVRLGRELRNSQRDYSGSEE